MKKSIERFTLEEIESNNLLPTYLEQEIPFIATHVFTYDSDRLTPDYIKNNFGDDNCKGMGWYNSNSVDNEIIGTPEIVKQVMHRSDMSFREMPMRIFMQPGGHVTLPHYDGNSLHGLNLQVMGRKKWILTSPHTPLPTIPFMFAGMVKRDFHYDPAKYDFMEFETRSGDLLFLPRYWYHEVHSLDKVNLNINWVFTPLEPNENCLLGRREVEIVKLRKLMPLINKAFPDDLNSYGGRGREIINRYTANVNNFRAFTRLLKEILKYPQMLILANQLKARAKEFSENNFNV